MLLGFSILAVGARFIIRIKTSHKLHIDDAFLVFGLACMCVATGLAYPIISIVYVEEAITFDPQHYTLSAYELPQLLEDLKIIDVFVVFAWTAEFSVKISLLLFFNLLVSRLKRLTIYVRSVIGLVTVVWAILVCEIFITCPHFGLSSVSESSAFLPRSVHF